jgi:hypothetical protein
MPPRAGQRALPPLQGLAAAADGADQEGQAKLRRREKSISSLTRCDDDGMLGS